MREIQNEAARFVLGAVGGQENGADDKEKASSNWLADQVANFEAELIQSTLTKHDGCMKQTYEELGISRRTLYDKIQKIRHQDPLGEIAARRSLTIMCGILHKPLNRCGALAHNRHV